MHVYIYMFTYTKGYIHKWMQTSMQFSAIGRNFYSVYIISNAEPNSNPVNVSTRSVERGFRLHTPTRPYVYICLVLYAYIIFKLSMNEV